ncbi:polysaccharide deacetylase family protein [Tabrizicola sp.]|uniref:polysaccharide deacetylase family protein n=1 Tax=Tabrizicola sp. TaxID=2005166 RepID=UPI0027338B51|nr:polysaccharide deacetylase family protein [Tabrizicola sp.]
MAKERTRTRSRKRHPVFLDVRQRRGHWLKIIAAISAFALLAWLTTVALGIYYLDILPKSAKLEGIRQGSAATDVVAHPGALLTEAACPGSLESNSRTARGASVAYLRSAADLSSTTRAKNCVEISGLLVEALAIDAAAQTVDWLDKPSLDSAVRDLTGDAPPPGIELVAMFPLPPIDGVTPSVLDNPDARARIIGALTAQVAGSGASGLCLYPYQFEFGHLAGLQTLLAELRADLAPDVTTCLLADAEGPLWRDARLIDAVDSVVLRAFREPDRDAPPGPLAPQDWFDTLIGDAIAATGTGKLRVALGSFGYMWTEGTSGTINLPFAEAMRLASAHKATIAVDEASLNTRITFANAEGKASEIWLLDAVTFNNQLLSLTRKGASGNILWSVGQEDPAAWDLFARGPGLIPAAQVEAVSFPDVVSYVGSGPFRKVIGRAAAGLRRFSRDPVTGYITGLTYDAIPLPFTVERFGALEGRAVALTFDDGPDDPYTTEILDTLKEQKVPATFFVIGANVVKYPDLVRRMIDEGHEVGSHTFFHPDETATGAERMRLELNALQRLLAGVTGRTTYLFRAPYGRSEGPMTRSEAEQHLVVEETGLVVAGGDIVPRDWEKMTAGEIVEYVMNNLTEGGGQVIVMHDAGGDRSETAAAVPLLIERLRAKGYGFVPLSSFIGLSPDEVMPYAADMLTPLDRAYYATLATVGHGLILIFGGAIAFGVGRTLLVLALALLRRRHSQPSGEPHVAVAIVIPAYNEELVISDAIKAALASDYQNFKVIVVDDGSTDDTAAIVQRDFGDDPRVHLIQQANGGKWSALNAAYAALQAEVVVAVDADAILDAEAVRLLADHFGDPRVGAVAGTVKVGNRRGLLQRLQALEYITAQSIDRRAAERLNAMLVVPGAIGAWRVEAVRKVGLYSSDTMTEDADLTIAVIRAGYRVVFEERATCTTNATETLRAFMKQRLRWSFGMMQTAWKHRRSARTAKGVGLFSIPDLWLTGVLLGLIAPFVDAVVAGVLIKFAIGFAQGLPIQADVVSVWVLAGWIALPLLDLLVALTAFGFDRREQWSLVLLTPLQRLVYRPLLYITVYRAVGLALSGRIASWGKLIRLGRVEKPTP